MEKNRTMAKVSFILSMFFWVPLLNNFFAIAAIIVGVKALRQIKANQGEYGGRRWAIAGIVLGIFPLVVYLLGFWPKSQ